MIYCVLEAELKMSAAVSVEFVACVLSALKVGVQLLLLLWHCWSQTAVQSVHDYQQTCEVLIRI